MSQWAKTSSGFSTHFVFFCTAVKTIISLLFLRKELNLQQFDFCVLSVEWFWKPLSILYWEQEGSACRPATCNDSFRGSWSVCSPARFTLYANDSCRTAQQMKAVSHVMCTLFVRLAMHVLIIRSYANVPMCRLTRTREIRFLASGYELGERKKKNNSRLENSRFRFRVCPSRTRKLKIFFRRLGDNRPIPQCGFRCPTLQLCERCCGIMVGKERWRYVRNTWFPDRTHIHSCIVFHQIESNSIW